MMSSMKQIDGSAAVDAPVGGEGGRSPPTLSTGRALSAAAGVPPTMPPLGPDHLVAPEPGLLVLFPSYMWHGTVPFTSQETRLTCAFDIVPAPGRAQVHGGIHRRRCRLVPCAIFEQPFRQTRGNNARKPTLLQLNER